MVSLKSDLKKHKLSLSFLLIILIFVVYSYLSYKEIQNMGAVTENIFSHPLVVSNAALNTNLNVIQIHRSMKDVAISTNTLELEVALSAVNKAENEGYRSLDIIQENILGIEGQKLERETRKLMDDWKPIRAKVIALTRDGKKDEAAKITKNEGARHVDKLERNMKALNFYARNKAIGFMNEASKTEKKFENLIIIMTFLVILLSAAIAIITVNQVSKYEDELKKERDKLQVALDEINILQGIIPICSYCKNIRDDDKGSWKRIEEYINSHTDAKFSHGVCPECMKKHFPEYADEVLKEIDQNSKS